MNKKTKKKHFFVVPAAFFSLFCAIVATFACHNGFCVFLFHLKLQTIYTHTHTGRSSMHNGELCPHPKSQIFQL